MRLGTLEKGKGPCGAGGVWLPVWQEALLSVCRQENRGLVSSVEIRAPWCPDPGATSTNVQDVGGASSHKQETLGSHRLQPRSLGTQHRTKKPKRLSSSETGLGSLFLEFENIFLWAIMRRAL